MKIKELKELIENLPDDMEVILSKDSEGNNYSPLSDGDPNMVYIPETTWFGDVYDMGWSAEDACMSDDEWERLNKLDKSLVLWPVN